MDDDGVSAKEELLEQKEDQKMKEQNTCETEEETAGIGYYDERISSWSDNNIDDSVDQIWKIENPEPENVQEKNLSKVRANLAGTLKRKLNNQDLQEVKSKKTRACFGFIAGGLLFPNGSFAQNTRGQITKLANQLLHFCYRITRIFGNYAPTFEAIWV